MLAAVLTTLFACQDPAPPKPAEPPAPAAEQQPAAPAEAPAAKPVEAWDDKTAKAALAEFQKLTKGSANMAQKNAALDLLAGGANKALVKPLAQVVETDKLVVVRKRAAELLGNQPAAQANPVIRRLLKNARIESVPAVCAEMVRALARCGYQKAHWQDVEDLFERDYAEDRVPIQDAVLDLVIATKEEQALPLLLRNLDEPAPANVDDPSNPPREYWEARWKAWSSWRAKVKEALFAITGQRFSTEAEAKAWLKANRRK